MPNVLSRGAAIWQDVQGMLYRRPNSGSVSLERGRNPASASSGARTSANRIQRSIVRLLSGSRPCVLRRAAAWVRRRLLRLERKECPLLLLRPPMVQRELPHGGLTNAKGGVSRPRPSASPIASDARGLGGCRSLRFPSSRDLHNPESGPSLSRPI